MVVASYPRLIYVAPLILFFMHCLFGYVALIYSHATGVDDFFDVYEEVVSIEDCFYKLGLALKLRPSDLSNIHSSYHQSPGRALTEVLQLWLQGKYNVEKHGPPTWRRLVEAVNSRTVGKNYDLAKQIASNHPATVAGIHDVNVLEFAVKHRNTWDHSNKLMRISYLTGLGYNMSVHTSMC